MKTISHLIVLGGIKLTLSLGCFPQNGFLMHSFAHENWKHVQRFHITLSSASALRIWWSYNNCTRGGLIYAVYCGSPGLSHDVIRDEVTVVIMCAEGAGVLSVSLWAQVQGVLSLLQNSGSLKTWVSRAIVSCAHISTHVPVQERTCMLLHVLHVMLIYN